MFFCFRANVLILNSNYLMAQSRNAFFKKKTFKVKLKKETKNEVATKLSQVFHVEKVGGMQVSLRKDVSTYSIYCTKGNSQSFFSLSQSSKRGKTLMSPWQLKWQVEEVSAFTVNKNGALLDAVK